jgi:hypothetical protein
MLTSAKSGGPSVAFGGVSRGFCGGEAADGVRRSAVVSWASSELTLVPCANGYKRLEAAMLRGTPATSPGFLPLCERERRG